MRRLILLSTLMACAPVPVETFPTAEPTVFCRPEGVQFAPPADAQPAPTTKVLTFNLRWDNPAAVGADTWARRRRGALAILSGVDADLVGTQEAMSSQVADLGAALPDYTRISVPTKLNPDQHDSMLFFRRRRYALLDEHHFWLSHTPDTPRSDDFARADPASGYGPRSVSCVLLADQDDGGRELVFCNTHFDGDRLVNEASARIVVERLKRRYAGVPTLLTGDFNALPYTRETWSEAPSWAVGLQSQTYGVLTEGLVDTQALLQPEHPAWLRCPKSECTPGWTVRIDWVLASRDFDVLETETLSNQRGDVAVTDHWPIVSTVALRRLRGRAFVGTPEAQQSSE